MGGSLQELLLFVLIASSAIISASPDIRLLFFGDSYLDTGNNNHIPTPVKSNFLPYGQNFEGRSMPTGRFSDGKIISDFLASGLGVGEVVPPYLDVRDSKDAINSVSFASSGCGLDNFTVTVLSVIPLYKQLEMAREYRDRLKPKWNANAAVAFISVGTNDFIANYFLLPHRSLTFTLSQFTDLIIDSYSSFIQELYGLGITRIGVINVPPLGCIPLERSFDALQRKGKCSPKLNDAAAEFNARILSMIESLQRSLPLLRAVLLDYYGIVSDILDSPTNFGFKETTKSCCGTGTVEFAGLCKADAAFSCPDPPDYLFFDAIHLTQKSYQIIANSFVGLIKSRLLLDI